MSPYKDRAFKPAKAPSGARATNFSETAIGIVEQERVERLRKTEKLRSLRLESEAQAPAPPAAIMRTSRKQNAGKS